MNDQSVNGNLRTTISILLIYILTFGLIIPAHGFINQLPANSVFNKSETISKQNNISKSVDRLGNSSVYFEENNGQFDSKVKYFARGSSGYSLFLTRTEAVYVIAESSKPEAGSPKSKINELSLDSGHRSQAPVKAAAIYMKLAGANENSNAVGLEELEHKTNYFKGNDESKWRTNVPNYRQIRMENVYQGIDTVWKGKENGDVQYDFVVKPNADPNQIEWEIEGAESVEVDEKGDLLINTELGTLKQQKPFTYQEESNGLKLEIESHFVVKQNAETGSGKTLIGFELGSYDQTKTLTIDPTVNLSNLAFSTFLGGGFSDSGNSIAVDRLGSVYVSGQTASIVFPTTPGTFDTSLDGTDDIFVTKLNPEGSELIFSTYIGGSGREFDPDIAVDNLGDVYISGYINGIPTDYPTTPGAFDRTHNGDMEAFVTKLDSTGASLIYSTFLGGSQRDTAWSIAIDSAGNAFVTGETSSDFRAGGTPFPVTAGAFDVTHNGDKDVFVTKINPAGTDLVYSTFIGSSIDDWGLAIAIDGSGNAVATGFTDALFADFPTTPGAFDRAANGESDVFVTKLNFDGSGLVFSTMLGGSSLEIARGVALDGDGNVLVTGFTNDATVPFPTTIFAFDQILDGFSDAFVTKLNPDGSELIYSSFIGGDREDAALDIVSDREGNAFIMGGTNSLEATFPLTRTANDRFLGGTQDAFATQINPEGTNVKYSTFLGGEGVERGQGIARDQNGNVFTTGETRIGSSNYPTTVGAFDRNYNGGFSDAFVTKLGDYSISGRTVDLSGNPIPNVSIALSGGSSGFQITGADGTFSFGDTTFRNFAVSASRAQYAFNPGTFQFPDLRTNQRLTFVGQPVSGGPTAAAANFGGKVESSVGNIGLPNAKLTLIDAATGIATVTHSDSNGDYVFEGLLTGTFLLVIPEKEGYDFNPGVYEVNHLQESLSNDFVATPNAPRPVDDFDGDGKTDLAVFRPSEGNWYILESESGSVKVHRFGLEGDTPVADDYDGDNRADIAVYRPTEGNWYRINSSDGQFEAIHFGAVGDKPVQADFDGDGRTDHAVYRPSSGVWHRLNSEDGSYKATQFGIETDVPVAADYDSDGKADLTVYRDGTWYRLRSSDSGFEAIQFGLAEDKPVTADFDGDGTPDTAVFRPSNGSWYWLESSDGDFQARQFGISTDVPTPADFNGDGRYEQSVFREGTWYVLRNDNSFYANQFGSTGDIPIP